MAVKKRALKWRIGGLFSRCCSEERLFIKKMSKELGVDEEDITVEKTESGTIVKVTPKKVAEMIDITVTVK